LDDVYKEWFNTESVSVKVELEQAEEFLTPPEIAELTGAPKNSRILVKTDGKVISFVVSNDIFAEDMHRYLVNESANLNYYLQNSVLVLKEEYTQKGIGPRCVIKEIHTAAKLAPELPINCIKVEAVGNFDSFHWTENPLRGYYVWARMGFDGKIPKSVLEKLPEKYKHHDLISSLMQDDDGRKEWLRHGDSVKLEFDLRPESISWKMLIKYMDENRIQL
jgi:hypothetical protein